MGRYRRVASEEAPERLWVIGSVCAILSAAVVYCLPMIGPIRVLGTFGEPDWIFLGIIHGLALLPAALLTKPSGPLVVLLTFGAATFPVWGFALGVPCMGLAGPLLPGSAWALLIMAVFSRRMSGMIVFLSNLAVSAAWIGLVTHSMFTSSDLDRYVRLLIPAWHFLITLGVYLGLYWEQPRVWRDGLCVKCRYPLEGLTAGICPECGTPITGNRGLASAEAPS